MINIKKELEKRGHIAIITESQDVCGVQANAIEEAYIKKHNDADFTLLPDEACRVIGGKGIYIHHALLPVTPQKAFYTSKSFRDMVNKKSDFLFISSKQVADIYINELKIYKPIVIVGLPKLDKVFIERKSTLSIAAKNTINEPINILYAPTHGNNLGNSSEKLVNIKLLKSMGNIIYIGHPSIYKKNANSLNSLSIADIVISDYSSVGYDSIALNIPTILIDNDHWNHISHKSKLICEEARNASIRVKTMDELVNAINTYKKNPTFLEKERLYYGDCLTKYKENASEIFVDELLKLV